MLTEQEEILKAFIQKHYFANSGLLNESANWQIREKAAELGVAQGRVDELKLAIAREGDLIMHYQLPAQPPLPPPISDLPVEEVAVILPPVPKKVPPAQNAGQPPVLPPKVGQWEHPAIKWGLGASLTLLLGLGIYFGTPQFGRTPLLMPAGQATTLPAQLAIFAPQKFTGRYRGTFTSTDGQPMEVWLDIFTMSATEQPPSFRYNLRLREVGGANKLRLFDQPGQIDPEQKQITIATEWLREFQVEVGKTGLYKFRSANLPGLVLE